MTSSHADPYPSHVLAAGVLVWDDTGHLLLVHTIDRDGLVLPGGIVEDDEAPDAAGHREVREETGLDVVIGRLLVVEHRPRTERVPSNVQLVFDSTPLGARPDVVLEDAEVARAVWLTPDEALEQHVPGGRRRLELALEGHRDGITHYVA